METINLADINVYDIGNEIQISGVIWTGKGHAFVTFVPDKDEDLSNLKKMPLTLPQWEILLKQTDLLETEIFQKDSTGITKIIVRKSQRQIDSYLQWAVFRRDSYTCRYCGRTGIPLSVDHIIIWEDGGPTIEENLISACRQCNKDRGRLPYEEWLATRAYLLKSRNLSVIEKQKNTDILSQLDAIRTKRVLHVRSR